MPLQYIIDRERRLVISFVTDPVILADILAHQDRLLGDSNFDPAFDHLVDATGLTKLNLSVKEIKTISGRSIFLPTSRGAAVTSSPLIFGVGRLFGAYQAMATGRENVGIFYNCDEALRWLGLDPFPLPLP